MTNTMNLYYEQIKNNKFGLLSIIALLLHYSCISSSNKDL